MSPYKQVAIVGVGLLGGSLALAVKKRGLAEQVVGIGRDQTKLDDLVQSGLIDRGTTDLPQGVSEADLVVVCTPVETVGATVNQLLQLAPAGCLLTDVGSTKQAIVEQVAVNPADGPAFVGSHPLAGDHRSGAEYARADLFDGRVVVVTPSEQTSTDATDRMQEFWQACGARVVVMSAAEHDAALAATSHLPHLVASVLAGSTPSEVLELAATGWLDTTRIAAADPTLWRQIFASNRSQVLAALSNFETQLARVRDALAEGDDEQLEQQLAEGKRTRDAVGN